jgi:hypothetical protein
MDKIKVDAVITNLELQLEAQNNPYGSYVCFRFIDTFPSFPKVNEMIAEINAITMPAKIIRCLKGYCNKN